MSKYRPFETKRGRLKISKNLASVYRQSKCRNCAVIVTPMDFAKILGKFTKVKIQYENSDSPPKSTDEDIAPISNARLKSNENGMVLIHRNAYQQHPVKELAGPKKQKQTKVNTKPIQSKVVSTTKTNTPAKVKNKVQRPVSNILKENNRVKKEPPKNQTTPLKDKNSNYNESKCRTGSSKLLYKVIFNFPQWPDDKILNNISLSELLPQIDKSILPSEVWDIDYFPKNDEPKDDKVYDRIAAELEDLMYNDKVVVKSADGKTEEFPSIMDILNDTEMENKKLNETNDVEAMLLGDGVPKSLAVSEAMDVDQDSIKIDVRVVEREGSPSILDENPENIVSGTPEKNSENQNTRPTKNSKILENIKLETSEEEKEDINKYLLIKKNSSPASSSKNNNDIKNTTHVIFKRVENGKCIKLVMCPRSLIYNVELEGKSVKLRGAPKFITSLEDLRVLLEIVDETEVGSFYVMY